MKQANSIVRTKTIYKHKKGNYYEIELMNYEKYLSKSAFIFRDTVLELYPYKWYDFRWIIDKSYYHLYKTFSGKNNNNLNLKSKKSIRIRLVWFIVETIATWGIIKVIAFILSIIWNSIPLGEESNEILALFEVLYYLCIIVLPPF